MSRFIRYPRAPGAVVAATSTTDGYAGKLVKYIPGEVIAFFTPISALIGAAGSSNSSAAGSNTGWLIAVTVVGALAAPAYVFVGAAASVRPYTYVLSTVAFVAWAFGVSPPLDAAAGLSAVAVGVSLGCAVFLIPLIDQVVTKVLDRPRHSAA